MAKPGDAIEARIAADDWSGARELIERGLRREPDNHWLLARLALTFYEQRDYATALRFATQARDLAPDCPLVLWEVGGALDMLDRRREAIDVYQQITNRNLDDLAHGSCGEGVAWARGLVADCYYRMGRAHEHLSEAATAADMYRRALRNKGRGAVSIYSHRMVEDALERVEQLGRRR
jgi:tetratricopeptide (TPR) repeat protein